MVTQSATPFFFSWRILVWCVESSSVGQAACSGCVDPGRKRPKRQHICLVAMQGPWAIVGMVGPLREGGLTVQTPLSSSDDDGATVAQLRQQVTRVSVPLGCAGGNSQWYWIGIGQTLWDQVSPLQRPNSGSNPSPMQAQDRIARIVQVATASSSTA
jgi:hypothetical protein